MINQGSQVESPHWQLATKISWKIMKSTENLENLPKIKAIT